MKKRYQQISFLILLLCIAPITKAQESKEAWSLRECIDFAINHNLSIKQAGNTITQRELRKETTKWSRLPNLNANASQNWNWGRSASPIDNTYTDIRTSGANFGVSTNIPLFTGLELPNQYALAKLDLEASVADLEKAKEDLSVRVTTLYFQVLFNEEIEGVAKRQVELSREQLLRGEAEFNLEKIAKADLAELKARVEQDVLRYVQAQNNTQLALLELTQLLELESPLNFKVKPIQEDVHFGALTPPGELYQEALLFKPEIKASTYRLEGAMKSIRIAKSGYLPKVSFGASLGTGYYTVQGRESEAFRRQLSNNFSKALGFSISIPIFNRLSTYNQVRMAKVDFNNQLLALDIKKKELYKEIQQAWYNAVASESKFRASKTSLQANQESFLLVKEKYELGRSNNLEFNEAKLNLMKAESDMIQAKYDYLFREKLLDFYKGIPIE